MKAASLDTTTQKVRSPLHDIDEGIRRSAGALLSRHNLMGIVIVAFTGPEDDPRCHSVAVDDWEIDPASDSWCRWFHCVRRLVSSLALSRQPPMTRRNTGGG